MPEYKTLRQYFSELQDGATDGAVSSTLGVIRGIVSPENLNSAVNASVTTAVANLSYATQAEAEAGTLNTKGMTPLRTSQAIKAYLNCEITLSSPSGGDDTATIVSAISILAAKGGGLLKFPSASFSAPFIITQTIYVPDTVFIQGTGKTWINPRDASNLGATGGNFGGSSDKFIFIVNSTNGTSWDTKFPGENPVRISGLRINNIKVYGANDDLNTYYVAEVRGIKSFGGYKFENLFFSGMICAIRRPVKTTDEYMDQFSVNRCGFTAAQKNTGGSFEYQCDVQGVGDGVLVENSNFPKRSGATGSSLNGNTLAVRLDGNGSSTSLTIGATIRNCIGGDYLVRLCPQVTICLPHSEHTQIVIDRSNAVIENSLLFAAGDQAGGVNRTHIITLGDDAGGAEAQTYNLALENVGFLWGYGVWQYTGFELLAHKSFNVTVKNCYRLFKGEGGRSAQCGIRASTATYNPGTNVLSTETALDAWNDYAHVLSRSGVIEVENWVSHNEVMHSAPSTFGMTGISKVASGGSGSNWSLASGTYYYRAQIIFDRVRLIGQDTDVANNSRERSVVIDPADVGTKFMQIPFARFASGTGPAIFRLYRGTATGVYDSFVDIPLLALGPQFSDKGDFCDGYPWQSRTAGTVDTLNQIVTASMHLRGRHIDVRGASGVLTKSVGTWQSGDYINNVAVTP